MKMLKRQSIGIAFAMLLSLCFVINSYAGSITYMYVYADTDYGNGANATAYVNTDADILYIKWSVGGTVDRWTMHEKGTRSVSEVFSFTGGIKGNKYEIEAAVWFWGDDDISDSDSYKFRVFKPKIISGTKYPGGISKNKRGEGVYGSVELYGHYHDGQNIVVSASAFARNKTKVDLNAYTSYRHAEFKDSDGDGLDEMVWSLEDPHPSKSLPKEGGTYSSSGSSMISYPVDGDIGDMQTIKLNAHVHMDVGGVVWHEEGGAWTHTFTAADNQ